MTTAAIDLLPDFTRCGARSRGEELSPVPALTRIEAKALAGIHALGGRARPGSPTLAERGSQAS